MIERHIEKIVLGVCLLLLVFCIAHWGISSPRKVEVLDVQGRSERTVSPDEAGPALFEAAEAIESRAMDIEPNPKDPPDWKNTFHQQTSDPFYQQTSDPLLAISSSIVLSPPRVWTPSNDSNGPQATKRFKEDIEDVIPQPSRPLVRVEREFTQKGDETEDVLVSHVVATFNVKDLSAEWTKSLFGTSIFADFVAVRIEAQIRERRSDGQWGKARDVSMPPRTDPYGSEIPSTISDFDGNNMDEVLARMRDLDDQQELILQPQYWDILWPSQMWGSWRVHLPVTSISQAILDEVELEQKKAKDAERQAEMEKRRMERVNRRSRETRSARSGMEARSAEAAREMEAMGARGRGGDRGRGSRDRGRRFRNARVRSRERRVTPASATDQFEEIRETPVPTFEEQLDGGEVLVWFHDTTLEPLKDYQYRLRLVLVNPLLTWSEFVKQPEDAKQASAATPWSEWSEAVLAPEDTIFYFSGYSEGLGGGRLVSVEVFKRGLGQWTSKRFRVSEGELVGDQASVRVLDMTDGRMVSKEINFSTGSVVVSIEPKTVKIGIYEKEKETAEVVYLDAKGQLQTRIVALDKDSKKYKDLKNEVKRIQSAARYTREYGR